MHEAGIVSFFVIEMKKHKKRQTNFKEGAYWINISQKELTKTIGIASLSTIQRACIKLEKLEIIKYKSFNKQKYDTTKFYTVINRQVLVELEYIDEDDTKS